MEKLLEALSFTAPAIDGQNVVINQDYVDKHISKLAADDDLARYIL